jgi:hypothetical protein
LVRYAFFTPRRGDPDAAQTAAKPVLQSSERSQERLKQFSNCGEGVAAAERNRRAIWGAMNAPGEDAATSRDSLPLASRAVRMVERV